MPPMEVGRDGVCAEAMNGHLYACGGYNVWHCLDSVERYNPEENHWSMVTPLNTARRGAGAAVLNNKLYVIGGTDGSNILKTVECYNSVTDTWSYVASMNSCRHNVGITVMNGYIFAVGGFDGVAFLNTSEFYDPELDKWCAFTQVWSQGLSWEGPHDGTLHTNTFFVWMVLCGVLNRRCGYMRLILFRY